MDLHSSEISGSAPEQQSDNLDPVGKLIDASRASVSAAVLVPAPADEQLKHPSGKSTASSDNALTEAVMKEPERTLRSPRSVAAGMSTAHLVRSLCKMCEHFDGLLVVPAGRQKPRVPPLPLPKHRRTTIKLTFTSAPHVPRVPPLHPVD